LIRCSAFCLSLDREHSRKAAARAAAIGRVIVGKPTAIETEVGQVMVLPVERGEGLPVVHGWSGTESRDGEFSKLSHEGRAVVASRDEAGTRPLYVARSGAWVSSDHRFFPREEADLLPPGSTYNVSSGRARRARERRASFTGTFEGAGAGLARLIDDAVKARVKGMSKVAVAFSGGLDSSIIASCAKRRCKVVACSVHSAGSRDSTAARGAAELLGVELLQQEVDASAVERELSQLELPFAASPMDRALWCIYSLASRAAADAGAEAILLGQLADELFGGYAKYQRALAEGGPQLAASLMEADVLGCGMRGFVRDEAACCRWLEPRFPFADARVLDFGKGLPVDFRVRRGERKAVLRLAARFLEVPHELSRAPKKAAQYSSGIQKLLV